MNTEWSLDILYKGYEDEQYKNDVVELQNCIKQMSFYAEGLQAKEITDDMIREMVAIMEKLTLLSASLIYYLELRQSTNTQDSETVNQLNQVEQWLSESEKPVAAFKKCIASYQGLDVLIKKDEKLSQYAFFFEEIREEAKHLLSDEVEEVIAKLNLSAGSAWSSMQSYLTSNLEAEYEGKSLSFSEIRNLAYSKDSKVREEAFYAELKALEKVKDPVSFSLNHIKSQVNTICELRGYEDALSQTLEASRMKKETLDALMGAIREYLPVFHKYLRQKAKLLGHANGLPWYDLFAPMGESSRTFTIEQAKDYLLQHFRGFADDLANMVETAFDDAWIDFYPKKGKVGGAFCENIPFKKQSRVLTNFTGSLSDVVTLAHELGHAYHGMMIEEHLPLNTDYSMPVAETASTFNEGVIMNAAIMDADDKEKITLIESQLQDVTQIICDIYSRFLFEQEVFERSKSEFLFADDLCDIMTRAQMEAYGNGLDHNKLHPYMWVLKGHYYSETLSFYNFPYAFGGLFAKGLYESYLKDKEGFLPKYRALLHATTVKSVEDAALEAGINLGDISFWQSSLKSYEKLVEEFITLTNK